MGDEIRIIYNTSSDTSESCISPDHSENHSSCCETDTVMSTSISTKLYKKRYLMLIIFILYSMSNAFQWIEYAIIQNIITKYYGVEVFWVNCTSVVYMVSYIIGIIPATWILEKKGLRFCVLIGSLGTCVGAWIKCFSAHPDRFWLTMIGQTVVAFSQLFVLNIPPLLAALWFSDQEVSRATAYGVFGNQLGIALGFFIPPNIVPNFIEYNATSITTTTISPNINNSTLSQDLIPSMTIEDLKNIRNNSDEVGAGLRILFYGVALFTSVLFIVIGLFFKNRPKYYPSAAQANAHMMKENASFSASLHSLFTNSNFVLLFFTYGLNAGVFYAVSTVLNQMVTAVFDSGQESHTEDAGLMGVLITISGIIGSLVCGYLLDWTKLFKEITLGVYLMALVGMLAFTGAFYLEPVIWPLFIVSALLGFFMTGYLPIGFELAAEISYPQPEGTFAGLLNTSAQIFGIIFTFGGSFVLQNFGYLSANVCFVVALIIGAVLTSTIKPDLRRQYASANANNYANDAKLLNKV